MFRSVSEFQLAFIEVQCLEQQVIFKTAQLEILKERLRDIVLCYANISYGIITTLQPVDLLSYKGNLCALYTLCMRVDYLYNSINGCIIRL